MNIGRAGTDMEIGLFFISIAVGAFVIAGFLTFLTKEDDDDN